LEAELATLEAGASPSPMRRAAVDQDASDEIQTELIQDGICEEIADALEPVIAVQPYTYRDAFAHPRISQILRGRGHGRALDRLSFPYSPLDARLREHKETIATEAAHQEWRKSQSETYRSARAPVAQWPVPEGVWRKAFICLAIEHHELGFEVEPITGRRTEFTKAAEIINDSDAHYGEYMREFLAVQAGDAFDPAAPIAAGHSKAAANAVIEVFEAEKDAGVRNTQRGGPSIATLRTVPHNRRKAWGAGPMTEVSDTFARHYEAQMLMAEVFNVAERMTGIKR
jgi:hypothetical protein